MIFGNKDSCDKGFQKLRSLLTELGFDISEHKTVHPANKVICLGILVDTTNFTLSIPDEKLQEIKNLCKIWKNKKFCSKNQLQSLLGSLLYVSKCVKYSRFFLNRLLQRNNHNKRSITLDEDFHRDISWFNSFLSIFNGTSFFQKKKIDSTIHLDACLTGMGAVYHCKTPAYLENANITTLEMYNILIATKLW